MTTTLTSAAPDHDSCDRRGLPLTTSPEAAARYREAVERWHGAQAGVAELLDQALAVDSRFALAHALRWLQAQGDGDEAAARAARDGALAALDGLSEWERSHVECVAAFADNEPDARAKAREHLAAHPLDLVIISQLIGNLFFHGGPGKREAVMKILRPLAPQHSDDWAFLARLGFHMSELGDPEAALAILEGALAGRPQAPFVAHAMAHVLLESGRRADSYRFLLDWNSRYDPEGPIDGHIQWHLSLGELESGEPAAATQRYLQESAPGASHCAAGLVLADAGGLLFRMLLRGASLNRIPRKELRELLDKLQPALTVPFVAIHAAALAVALGDAEGRAYLDAMQDSMDGPATNPAARVVSAFRAYRAGSWQACVDALETDRLQDWEAIGGSNEERALIAELYTAARDELASP